MPHYSPSKERRGPEDVDPHLAERLLAHAEETLHAVEGPVGGPKTEQAGKGPVAISDPAPPDSEEARVRQFLYMVTHDLQSPLSAMSLRLGLLERHLTRGDLEGICKDLTVLSDAYGRMRDLVQGILAYAESGGSKEREDDVSLDAAVAAAVRLFGDDPVLRRARLDLRPLPVVRGQPQALARLFQNLIGNAVKYRHPDRPLRLKIEATRDPDGSFLIQIHDNGIGLDPATAASLFAPFVRGIGIGPIPGHGIGLASCARIASDHGATLEATGRPGVGATFTVRFPTERVLAHTVRGSARRKTDIF